MTKEKIEANYICLYIYAYIYKHIIIKYIIYIILENSIGSPQRSNISEHLSPVLSTSKTDLSPSLGTPQISQFQC